MKVPLAWLRDYVELPADPARVAEMLAAIGFPVDAIEERPVITGVVAGRIAELRKHPNADRLQVGSIEIGDGAPLTIATAATNVAQGQTIAVATVGAQLPQLRIERRKMRGLESEGMMISAEELALPAEWFEDGIMQIEADVPLGCDVVEYFRLSEAVLDVDVTANRPDALSMIGLARELAAYQGVPLRLPEFDALPPADTSEAPRIDIESPDCRTFVAQRFSGVTVAPAPAWMRIRLALAGQRPINNLVDVSNYAMLETGQPMHFYDEAKIPNRRLIVRDARPEEKLVTLDGVEYELTPQALLIATEDGPAGLAGIKGGKASEVSDDTSAILLESANFNGPRIRRTSAALALRTEASTRHEKSLPISLAEFGRARASHLLRGVGARPGAVAAAGESADATMKAIEFDTRDVLRLLGYELNAQEIAGYLDRLGFACEPRGEGRLSITPPHWRTDVAESADVVEEVARMAGYDRIESAIPAVREHGIESREYRLESAVARTLASLGYREIATYALHGKSVFDKLARASIELRVPSVEVLNPLSEDQRYLRYSLTPAILEYLARLDTPARVFETGHVFLQDDRTPQETPVVTFGFTAEPVNEPDWHDSSFLRLKGDCEALVQAITGRRDCEAVRELREGLHPGKTAVLLLGGREIAAIGRIDPRLQKAFGVRLPAYVGQLRLDAVPEYSLPHYVPPPKYPSTYRDLALVCDVDLPAERVQSAVRRAAGPLCVSVRAFDEYRGPQAGPGKKSLAVRVTLQRADATITDEEADDAIGAALQTLRDELNVTLRA